MLRPAGGEVGPEVIAACQRGDRDALRVVYDAYRDKVYSIAFYFFRGDASAAADVTQQVFLKLIDGMSTYRGDAAFATWLYRLVINACVDRTRQRRSESALADPAVLMDLPDPAASIEEDVVRDEMAHSVRAAIAALPPKLRLAVLLRYFDDLSYSDMAAALECTVGTVSSRLSRAHRLLARRLDAVRGSRAVRPEVKP